MLNFFKSLLSSGQIEKVDIGSRFQLISRIGQGSMSKVWRAIDLRTSRTVCLKVLDYEKTKQLESRFTKMETPRPLEGEVAMRLNHPHIVKTFEFGLTKDNEQFLVMEFLEGYSLSYLVDAQNKVMKENRLRFVVELAEALEYFHRQNWIHRDICPRNIMIDEGLSLKLIDFGLVVPNIPEYQAPGNRTGTAVYMAPELIKRQRTDQRIDIFAFAVTAFEMYARQLPWPGGESLEAVVQHINLPPKQISKLVPGIHPVVAKTIMKGLAVLPDDRWQSMSELLVPLRWALANPDFKLAE